MLIEDIVDSSRYAWLATNDPRREQLVAACREELRAKQYCCLPQFVTDAALLAMQQEATELQHQTFHNNSLRNCYLHKALDPALPDDHPRNMQDRSSVRMIAYDQLSSESVLKVFYHADAVRSLVADIVGRGPLFDNEDPYQPANYVCYRDQDESSWHFDADNSFTMTLMVQAAEHGGHFAMSPATRTTADQNYERVAQVLGGGLQDSIVSVAREPGALCIFKGSNSLHRVSPVVGDTLRIMGVFVYEFEPGVVGDDKVNATIYGPRVA